MRDPLAGHGPLVGHERLTVQCRSGVPFRFLRSDRRRGAALLRAARWYRVRAVVASWVESPPWWRIAGDRGPTSTDPVTKGLPSTASIDASPAPSIAARSSPVDARVWRVEARVEPTGPVGVFDLLERPDGAWALARAHD